MRTATITCSVVLFTLCCGCETQQKSGADVSTSEQKSELTAPESIGEATMKQDGTLVLQLRAAAPGGGSGDALIEYGPTNPDYQETLDHIGGLKPGESKAVPPWPDDPPKQVE